MKISRTTSPLTRFLMRCKRQENGCIVLEAMPSQIYPRIKIKGKPTRAVRFAYQTFVGPIPEGMQLDHLCFNTKCVNPLHVEPVTGRENTLRSNNPAAINSRKTQCVNGHPFDDENTYTWNGMRGCITCRKERSRDWYQNRVKIEQEQTSE